jgi:hypothetical protein
MNGRVTNGIWEWSHGETVMMQRGMSAGTQVMVGRDQ